MPFTAVAFYESVDQAGAYVALNAVPDQHVRVVGDDIQVPTLNRVIAVAAGVETAAANRARLVSPSLRELANFQICPLNGAAAGAVEPGSPQAVVDLRHAPLQLVTGEQLNLEALANPVAAQIQWGFVLLADGPIEEVGGRIFTVRATSATALVAGTWTNVALTFDEDIPRGRYQVVGLCGIAAGLIACRCVFVGGGPRPGVLGKDLNGDLEHEMFRYGGLGVYGEFEDTEPPTIDALSVSADATPEYWCDLVQLRKGPA
jgi:hypothetical protein